MKLALIAALCLFPVAAFAQTSSTTGTSGTNSTVASNSSSMQTPLKAKVKTNLQAAGFTDIQIVPEGFIVNAKDQDGTPVTMLINPHSVAEFVGSNNSNGAAGKTQSSASGTSSGKSTH